DRFGAIGSLSGHTVSFGPNFRITDVSFPPAFGQDNVSPTYMGDYDQAVADNGAFYITWGDNRLANPNYAPHVNQPDGRFAKIPVTGMAGLQAEVAAANLVMQTLTSAEVQPMRTALAVGHTVRLDDNAADWAWLVDRTRRDDSDWTTPVNQHEDHRTELLAVPAREIAWLSGKQDHAEAAMAELIAARNRQPFAGPTRTDCGVEDEWFGAIDEQVP